MARILIWTCLLGVPGIAAPPKRVVLEGVASFYGERFRGRLTHDDEVFDPDKLTAACNVLPLKTWVRVTNLRNHRRIALWINDRMHPQNKRLIDVSARAARELGFYARGLTRVRVEVVTRREAHHLLDSLGLKFAIDTTIKR